MSTEVHVKGRQTFTLYQLHILSTLLERDMAYNVKMCGIQTEKLTANTPITIKFLSTSIMDINHMWHTGYYSGCSMLQQIALAFSLPVADKEI